MRLGTIEVDGARRAALILNDEAIDLSEALDRKIEDAAALLESGIAFEELERRGLSSRARRVPLDSVKLHAPILRPGKILGVAMNYHSFVNAALERGMPIPPARLWFLRPNSCIAGARDDIWLPQGATDLDFEVELAIVIGTRCRDVPAKSAHRVIAGFTIANDLTLRRMISKSLAFAKAFDTHTPVGPWIVTENELGDPHSLAVRTWVNGELRQDGNTADMIERCYELIQEISENCTLNPGDLILTGTPAGSGIFESPPAGLCVGDVVRLEIEGIGSIENRVISEPDASANFEKRSP